MIYDCERSVFVSNEKTKLDTISCVVSVEEKEVKIGNDVLFLEQEREEESWNFASCDNIFLTDSINEKSSTSLKLYRPVRWKKLKSEISRT